MIRKTLMQYLLITSVKGIPRLLRTKSRSMRFVWGLSVGCFLLVAVYQAILLTESYLTYSTVTSVREIPLDLIGGSEDSVQLPDITFCNCNPFANNFTQDVDILSIQGYIAQVRQMTTCNNCSLERSITLSQLRDELMTSRGYYVQIGPEQAKRISHQKQSTFIACNVWVTTGMHASNLPCDGIVRIEPRQDSIFFNCFTLIPEAEQTLERVLKGLIIVFHLDDYAMNNSTHVLPLHPNIGYVNGIVYAFHDRGTPPVLIRNQVFLQPGLLSILKIGVQRQKRLSSPYGRCVKQAHDENMYVTEGPYSQLICFSVCRQHMVLDTCGCIDHNNYVDVLSRTGHRACLKLDNGWEHLWKEWECLQYARTASVTGCTDKCPLPCEEVTFEEKATHTSWPAGHLKSFYREYISNRSYASHYEALADDNIVTDIEELKLARRISQHFVALEMIIDKTTILEYRDQPQLSFIGFVSQLGGALNLWAGITVVVVIEVVELLFELIIGQFAHRKIDITTPGTNEL